MAEMLQDVPERNEEMAEIGASFEPHEVDENGDAISVAQVATNG